MGLWEDLEITSLPTIFYRRDGTPIDGEDAALVWARAFGQENRRVAETQFWWGGYVSTVFLGLEHGIDAMDRPLIFETMVFPPFAMFELAMRRYATEDEAKAGHAKLAARWRHRFWYMFYGVVRQWQSKRAMAKVGVRFG